MCVGLCPEARHPTENFRSLFVRFDHVKVCEAFHLLSPNFTEVMGRSDSPLFIFSRAKETKITESFFCLESVFKADFLPNQIY